MFAVRRNSLTFTLYPKVLLHHSIKENTGIYMRDLIASLNSLARKAGQGGFPLVQNAFVSAVQELEALPADKPLDETTQKYFKLALADLHIKSNHIPANTTDVALFQEVTAVLGEVAYTRTLVEALKAKEAEQRNVNNNNDDDDEDVDDKPLRDFKEAQRRFFLNRRRVISLENLKEQNARYEKLLRDHYGLNDVEMGKLKFARLLGNNANYSKQTPGLLNMFSKLMKDFADPEKDIQSTMKSFMGALLGMVVEMFTGFFKKAFGKDHAPEVEELGQNTAKAFERFTSHMEEQQQRAARPFAPQYAAARQQDAERRAEAAAAQEALGARRERNIRNNPYI